MDLDAGPPILRASQATARDRARFSRQGEFMSEVELGALAAAPGLFRKARKAAFEAGGHCDNCATELKGPWCYACGQEAEEARRSVLTLVREMVLEIFEADGRLWQTLPRLFARPGQLTRDYVDGKRAPQAPPFSMFLVVVVLFVAMGALTSEHQQKHTPEAVRAQVKAQALAGEQVTAGDGPLVAWIKTRGRIAVEQPERFALVAEEWEHRAAIVMLPISALLLTLAFAFKRRFMVYDHLIFSMHSLTFFGLVLSASMAASMLIGGWATWLWLAAPIHLFFHMRRFYEIGAIGTLLRMGFLGVGSFVLYALLLFGLVLISLNEMTA